MPFGALRSRPRLAASLFYALAFLRGDHHVDGRADHEHQHADAEVDDDGADWCEDKIWNMEHMVLPEVEVGCTLYASRLPAVALSGFGAW